MSGVNVAPEKLACDVSLVFSKILWGTFTFDLRMVP